MIVALTRGTTVLALPEYDGAETDLLWAGFELPAYEASVADARRRVWRQLRRWAFPADVCDTARLLVSELFANAVLHTESTRVRCLMSAGGSRVRVEIHDEGSERSVPLPSWVTPDDESGRGLLLVDVLAQNWGVDRARSGRGNVVWVELTQIGG